MHIKGKVRIDKKTKQLVNRMQGGEIAVIYHKDLDEIAAKSLIEKKVKAVINCDLFISGKYPNIGPKLLHDRGIPLFEATSDSFHQLVEGEPIEIFNDNKIIKADNTFIKIKRISIEEINKGLEKGEKNLVNELDNFIENTLNYAYKEKEILLKNICSPNIHTRIKNKHVLVVVRGKNYHEDLTTITPYINEVKPVLMAVDGGGDALLNIGLIPDILIGDMDSVSENCIMRSKEIIVHGYSDGRAPGLERVERLRNDAKVFSSLGTSEDVAMLLAFEKGAKLIVAVGTHTNIVDFLEKGRAGMASTLLVRMKIGTKLIDAKGVNQLYKSSLATGHIFWLAIASLIPIAIIFFASNPMQYLLRIIQMRIRLFLGI